MSEEFMLGKEGIISIIVDWNEYDHQRAGGLISGVLTKNDSVVDCDLSAFVMKKYGDKYENLGEVNYAHPSFATSAIIHHGDNTKTGRDNEKLDVNLESISEDESIVLTLDTLKDKKRLKIGRISQISISIYKNGNELYRTAAGGTGERAVRLGKIFRENNNFFFKVDMTALNGVNEKSDILSAIFKGR